MVIVRIWEGLGNQMFQYAYARALKAKGIEVGLDLDKTCDTIFAKYKNHSPRENAIENFRITIPSVMGEHCRNYSYLNNDTVVRKIIFWLACHSLWKYRFYEETIQAYSKRTARIRGDCYVKGWFQSEKYFMDIRSELLKEFIPKKKIRISGNLKNVLADKQSVSVHIRRGDYVKIYQALNAAYYKKAIEYLKGVYDNPVFLLFSDDLDWVKENIPMNGRYMYVNENGRLKDYEELFIMSRCRSNIIANSTFSWWAAWLNQNADKHVIAPKKWMESQGNIVPEDWTLL